MSLSILTRTLETAQDCPYTLFWGGVVLRWPDRPAHVGGLAGGSHKSLTKAKMTQKICCSSSIHTDTDQLLEITTTRENPICHRTTLLKTQKE